MDGEHKEGLLIISKALILLCEQMAKLNEQTAQTNELLTLACERLANMRPAKWIGGPK